MNKVNIRRVNVGVRERNLWIDEAKRKANECLSFVPVLQRQRDEEWYVSTILISSLALMGNIHSFRNDIGYQGLFRSRISCFVVCTGSVEGSAYISTDGCYRERVHTFVYD